MLTVLSSEEIKAMIVPLLTEKSCSTGTGNILPVVYFVQFREQSVAVKVYHTSELSDSEFYFVQRDLEEVSFFASHNPSAEQHLAFGRLDAKTYFITKRVAGQSLEEMLNSHTHYTWNVWRSIFVRVAGALQFWQSYCLFHGNLCPATIMYDAETERITLVDVGLGGRLDSMRGGSRNRLRYMAPEVARGSRYKGTSEVYSLGCTMFAMATRQVPWADENEAKLPLLLSDSLRVPGKIDHLPSVVSRVIDACWQWEPKGRTRLNHLIKSLSDDEAFKDIDNKNIE